MSSYGQKLNDLLAKNALVVDLRSDTISKPSPAMRQAMFDAQLGDDVYGEDPTVNSLEERVAKLLGKEAAIFVSSGTMGNLIAVMNHCDVRGSELYCGEESHVVLHEQGGAAQVAGATVCALPNLADGTFDLGRLEARLRKDRLHEPISKLVVVENTISGRVVPQRWVDELAALARRRGLRLHLDGARLWNAAAASGLPARRLAEPFDSVTFCLSKGLGAPAGSLLCGTRAFVDGARRSRKLLGGGMRQLGVLAAAGHVALDQVVPLLPGDHARARRIAQAVNDAGSPLFSVDLDACHTNMVLVKLQSDRVSAADFVRRLQEVGEQAGDDDRTLVRGLALSNDTARFVTYYEIDDELTRAAIAKIQLVIKQMDSAAAT